MMMERVVPLLATVMLLLVVPGISASDDGPDNPNIEMKDPVISRDLIENRGQLDDESIRFYTLGRMRAALGDDFIRYSMERKTEEDTVRTDCWEVQFTGSSQTEAEPVDRTSTVYNFFFGNDPKGWFTNVDGYSSVIYERIYPGIDMVFHTDTGDLKYDLVLHPGSDPSSIMLTVKGHESLEVIDNELVIELSDGTFVRERGLHVFYRDTGITVPASFTLIDENTFTFSLADYDITKTIVIDPVIFSTWIGGLGSDQAWGMKVDGAGNTYVTGATTARQFPVTDGAYEKEWQGSQDAYLFRMNDTGKGIDFCTLIGGSADEAGMVIDLDDTGNIYLSGRVFSDDFPFSPNAYSRTHSGGYDVFVSKFDSTASNLLYSTYVGGQSSEWPQNIVCDKAGSVFVGGISNGIGFPTSDEALVGSYGGGDIDGFLFKLNPQGSQIQYSTYIGGDHDDRVTGLVVDDQGFAYITGFTRSSDFILTQGAYDTTPEGSSDAYIMKVATNGKTAVYSTLFGGSEGDGIYDLAMDDEGDLVFTGLTYSPDLPASSGLISNTHIGDADIFLAEMDINCTQVKRCTYIGSSGYERPTFLDIGPAGRVTIAGSTSSSSFPVSQDALLSSVADHSDDFLITVLSDWSDIQYSTIMGGGRMDQLAGAGADDTGRIFAAGSTDNANFPTTPGSFNENNNGFEDAYVFSISLDTPPTPPRDLMAVSGDGFVNLTWNTPENPGSLDLTGYDIFRGEKSSTKTFLTTIGKDLHYNDTDVENGITYFYHIRAKNLALDSLPSIEVQATPLGPPSAPSNFRAESGYMKVELSWDPPLADGGTPVTGFSITRTSGEEEFTIDVPPERFEHTDDEIEAGTDYMYVVRAKNIVGTSLPSAAIPATPFSEPSSPLNLTLRSGDAFVEISWEGSENDGGMTIREYNIYRGVSGAAPALLKNMGANVKRYNDTTVHNGLEYSYYVVAVNIIGESVPSDTLDAVPMTLPGAPLNFMATGKPSKVELVWETPISDGGSPVSGY
ncbi:MAG: fibronectin type III domain-containing protein, partial [Thermoplasmatota archaeon]